MKQYMTYPTYISCCIVLTVKKGHEISYNHNYNLYDCMHARVQDRLNTQQGNTKLANNKQTETY